MKREKRDVLTEEQNTVRSINCPSTMNQVEHEEYQQRLANPRAAGRYTLEEAARMICEPNGENEKALLDKLVQAVRDKSLPRYWPQKKQSTSSKIVRYSIDEVYWHDLNNWLAEYEPKIEFRFPDPKDESIAEAKLSKATEDSTHWINRNRVMDCFAVLPDVAKNQRYWNDKLGQPPKWLIDALKQKGMPGKSSLWCPITVAHCLLGKNREPKMSLRQLNTAMHKHFPELNERWKVETSDYQ